ncbi:ATP synthase F1 subunit epsilon [Caproiciproducens galactitolivorans]|uniref:ATP synthase epsilon chain n=1 Tax=Caproiciproducens galactitolivorans TaxID=642589 RepID=A0ABT4BQ96_9FIRM|nr:ATP synthase F1 subunit epsilon [Caproiciproducens galactitolivorans]MCY1712979.1 ATP synthase F1 subunit epsilon [Caproiciproducens galactitolivorans]
MDTFALKIIAINKVFYEGNAKQLIFSAVDGLVGIMAHHEDAVIAVNVGEVKIQTAEDRWVIAISGAGHIQIDRNHVVMMVDTVEYPEEIDEQRALEAKERAEEQLRREQSLYEYAISKACLIRAIERLKIKKKYSAR